MAEQDGCQTGRPRSGRGGVVAVGLTGGIGAGKSTALSLFAELGAVTTSADQIVHDLYEQSDYISRLEEHFGSDVLDSRGRIDRRSVALLVKGRREDLRWLEELTHPLVAEEIQRVISEAPAGTVVVCEVPLLFESHFEDLFDLIVTIEAGRANRVTRSAHRFDQAVFDEFEGLQTSTERRVAGSDLVCFNDGSIDHMRTLVREAFAEAVARLGVCR